MSHTFNTIAEAISAGYESASTRTLETHRGFEIRIRDTSGPGSFGYSFGIVAVPSETAIRQGKRTVGPFGSTVDVWFNQERNKTGSLGAGMAMFPPGALGKAIAQAKTAVEADA